MDQERFETEADMAKKKTKEKNAEPVSDTIIGMDTGEVQESVSRPPESWMPRTVAGTVPEGAEPIEEDNRPVISCEEERSEVARAAHRCRLFAEMTATKGWVIFVEMLNDRKLSIYEKLKTAQDIDDIRQAQADLRSIDMILEYVEINKRVDESMRMFRSEA